MNGGIWRMVVAMSLSGTIGLFVLLSGQSAQTVVFFRCLIGGLALLGWLSWKGAWQRLTRQAIGWLVLGAAALILNWLCLFTAYRASSISVATVVYHLQPFFLILLAALAQKELPNWSKLSWLLLAFLGVVLISGIKLGANQNAMLEGVLLAVVAAFLYAVATVATRKLTGVPPAQIAGLQLILGAAVLAPLANFSPEPLAWQSWASLLILGLVHTGLDVQPDVRRFPAPARRHDRIPFIHLPHRGNHRRLFILSHSFAVNADARNPVCTGRRHCQPTLLGFVKIKHFEDCSTTE